MMPATPTTGGYKAFTDPSCLDCENAVCDTCDLRYIQSRAQGHPHPTKERGPAMKDKYSPRCYPSAAFDRGELGLAPSRYCEGGVFLRIGDPDTDDDNRSTTIDCIHLSAEQTDDLITQLCALRGVKSPIPKAPPPYITHPAAVRVRKDTIYRECPRANANTDLWLWRDQTDPRRVLGWWVYPDGRPAIAVQKTLGKPGTEGWAFFERLGTTALPEAVLRTPSVLAAVSELQSWSVERCVVRTVEPGDTSSPLATGADFTTDEDEDELSCYDEPWEDA